MTLDDWLTRDGAGARQRMHFATKLSLPTIDRAREGRASKESAEKISAYTRGQVPARSMYPATDEQPRVRARRRARA